MEKETRTVRYDEELRLEAYRFEKTSQPFPNHFHEYYVIGFVEQGERRLSCKNKEYRIGPGNIILFNPGDSHGCSQAGGRPLIYCAFNISKDVMLDIAKEVTGKRKLPGFSKNVVEDEEILIKLCALHRMVLSGASEFEKEETLLLLFSALISEYGMAFERCIPECREEIERACAFIKSGYAERISLEDICRAAALSKSTLLRAFTKSKGVTPYRYLEAVRISEAKKLLEQGVAPVDAAMQTGFSDQSHFTNFFNMFIGLTPGIYRDIFTEKRNTVHGGIRHEP